MSSGCVVFDLDDTLYLERHYVRSGFRVVGEWADKTLGVSDFGSRAWTLFEQGERGHIFNRALTDLGITPDRNTITSMVDVYRAHMPDISLATDAEECLRCPRGHDRLALVSDGPLQSQRNKIIALELGKCFEISILTSELGEPYAKPHPEAFSRMQKFFGFAPDRYIYVADNPHKDFLGPRSLGWRTIRVRRPEGLYSALEADSFTRADLEVPDLSNLHQIILGRFWEPF